MPFSFWDSFFLFCEDLIVVEDLKSPIFLQDFYFQQNSSYVIEIPFQRNIS